MNKIEELRYLIKGVDKEGENTYKKMLSEVDITPNQNEVLKILSKKNGLTVVEVGDLLICGSDSPSRVVQRLVNKNLVEKRTDPKDARKTLLYLTEDGKKTLSKSSEIENSFNEQIQKQLDGSIDIDHLIEVLSNQIRETKSSKQIQNRKRI